MDQNLKVRHKPLKPLEEDKGDTLQNISISSDFLTRISTAQEIITGINQWDCNKLKSFCLTEETMNRVNRQPTEWEKIL
jgi:hypothetical protein